MALGDATEVVGFCPILSRLQVVFPSRLKWAEQATSSLVFGLGAIPISSSSGLMSAVCSAAVSRCAERLFQALASRLASEEKAFSHLLDFRPHLMQCVNEMLRLGHQLSESVVKFRSAGQFHKRGGDANPVRPRAQLVETLSPPLRSFGCLLEAKVLGQGDNHYYNTVRLPSSLGYLTTCEDTVALRNGVQGKKGHWRALELRLDHH